MTSVTTSHCHCSSTHSPLEVTSRSIIIYNQFWPFLQHSIYRFFYMLLAQPSSPSRRVDHNRPPKSTSINLKSLPNTVIQPLMEGSLLKVVAKHSHEHVYTHRRNTTKRKSHLQLPLSSSAIIIIIIITCKRKGNTHS